MYCKLDILDGNTFEWISAYQVRNLILSLQQHAREIPINKDIDNRMSSSDLMSSSAFKLLTIHGDTLTHNRSIKLLRYLQHGE